MMRAWIWTAWLGLCATVAMAAPVGDEPPVANDREFHEALREIARVYKQFPPVDFESRWAPTFCRSPYKVDFAVARVSASKDEATHGRKVYYLFAKDRSTYRALSPQWPNEPKKKLDTWSDNKTPNSRDLAKSW